MSIQIEHQGFQNYKKHLENLDKNNLIIELNSLIQIDWYTDEIKYKINLVLDNLIPDSFDKEEDQ